MASDQAKARKAGLVFTAVGVVLVAIGIFFLMKDYATLKWPAAPGTILSSEVTKYRDSSKNKWVYIANIHYQYTVGNRIYNGSKVHASGFNNPFTSAQSLAKGYNAGQTVNIYHNPLNPNEAILIRGVSFGVYLFMGFGAIALLAGIHALKTALFAGIQGTKRQ
jgi:hypothetical protein